MWDLNVALQYIAAIFWIGGMAMAEKKILSLPPSFHFLIYAEWMSLFIVPGLAFRFYSRRRERRANETPVKMDNPRAAMSGFYKLHALNKLPRNRPWWSRVLSTHPTLDEELSTFGRAWGISRLEIDAIISQADMELAVGAGDRYNVPEEASANIERRHAGIWIVPITVCGIFLAAVLLCIALVAADNWFAPMAIMLGCAGAALALLLPIDAYRRASDRKLRSKIISKLSLKYGDQVASSGLLVDACFPEDLDEAIWQGSVMTFSEQCVSLYGEARTLTIDRETSPKVHRWTNDEAIGVQATGVVIDFESHGVPRSVVIRILGRPEKGEPQKQRVLQDYVLRGLAQAGVEIQLRKKLTLHELIRLAPRAAITALIVAAVMASAELITRTTRLNWGWWPHYLALSVIGPAIWSWLTRISESKRSD
jgi:hypothetical protein